MKTIFRFFAIIVMLTPTAVVLYMFRDCIREKYLNKYFPNDKKADIQVEKVEKKNVDIIATLGKEGWKNIPAFCESGANIFRINGSHIKNAQQLKETIAETKKQIANEKCKNARIMYDTQGPEIRTIIFDRKQEDIMAEQKTIKESKQNKRNKKGKNNKAIGGDDKLLKQVLPEKSVYNIMANDIVMVHTNLQDKEVVFDPKNNEKKDGKVIHIGVNYAGFINDVKDGMLLTIENRAVYARVESKDAEKQLVKLVITSVNTNNGELELTDRRHINLIGEPVSLPTLTENDKEYIKISVSAGVQDYAISFVRDDKDIEEVRDLIKNTLSNEGYLADEVESKMKSIRIIAKIETKQGVDNIDGIMQKADGAMVARGDLASEIPMIAVPYAKKTIIDTSNKYKRYSIMATDVLESMTRQQNPSRNDIDVVATSLQLGVDAIMLSNETAQSERGIKAIGVLKENIDYFHSL